MYYLVSRFEGKNKRRKIISAKRLKGVGRGRCSWMTVSQHKSITEKENVSSSNVKRKAENDKIYVRTLVQ